MCVYHAPNLISALQTAVGELTALPQTTSLDFGCPASNGKEGEGWNGESGRGGKRKGKGRAPLNNLLHMFRFSRDMPGVVSYCCVSG